MMYMYIYVIQHTVDLSIYSIRKGIFVQPYVYHVYLGLLQQFLRFIQAALLISSFRTQPSMIALNVIRVGVIPRLSSSLKLSEALAALQKTSVLCLQI